MKRLALPIQDCYQITLKYMNLEALQFNQLRRSNKTNDDLWIDLSADAVQH